MPTPDFLRLHCISNIANACSMCNRDFVIPINAIEGMYRTSDDKVDVCIKDSHYLNDPRCLSADGVRGNMIIKTSMLWNDFIDALDGRIEDCGNIEMVNI